MYAPNTPSVNAKCKNKNSPLVENGAHLLALSTNESKVKHLTEEYQLQMPPDILALWVSKYKCFTFSLSRQYHTVRTEACGTERFSTRVWVFNSPPSLLCTHFYS